ncbi:MAG: T9SS type A sorting domain-containing protein [Bacteroidetes bacterium]|nr:T9SS type A sorting domain-containing protein [Bacteroidota bacterium]
MKYLKITILSIALIVSSCIYSQTVKHFAGRDNAGDNGPLYYNNSTCVKDSAYFYFPEGINWDANGNLWITEKNKIRLLYNGNFYNRAGKLGPGDQSQRYQNGTGIMAQFYAPTAIVSDASGVLYIVDSENHAIRKMEKFSSVGQNQAVTTFVGAPPTVDGFGTPGSSNGNGTNATFYNPKGIVRDGSGNFYITEFNNFTIRKVTSSGTVTTLAGQFGTQGSADGTGTSATFGGPYGIAQLDNNYVVVSDFDNGTIRKVHMSTGAVTTICGKAGDNRYADGNFTNARFREPRGLTVVDGKIYVCDGSVIRVIDINTSTVSTYAGSTAESGNKDGEGTAARFGTLGGIAYDGKISLYVTDLYYNVIKTVKINGLAPVTAFTASKTSALVDEIVTLTNTSTGKPTTSLKWTITSVGLSHSIVSGTETSLTPIGVKFHAAGFYNVKLWVKNSYGQDSLAKNSYISISTTGINKVNNEQLVTAYPNPTNGLFTLQSLNGNYPVQSFEIIDLSGKTILKRTCGNTLSEEIDLSCFKTGIYYLKAMSSKGISNIKLQKL